MTLRTWRALRLMVTALAFALAVGGGAVACFSGGSSGTGGDTPDAAPACPSDVPQSCPAVIPSWSGQVQAIVASRCGQCHEDGGVEAKQHNFDTYAHVYAQRTSILTQVAPCKMPPPEDAAPLTADERAALLNWLVCKAPQN